MEVRLKPNFLVLVHFHFLYLMLPLIVYKNCKAHDEITLALEIR